MPKNYITERSQGKASPRAVLVRSIRLVLGSSVETTAAPLTLRRAMYTQSHTLTVVQGGGGRGWWTPPRYWYVAVYVAVLQQNFHMVLSILFVDLTFNLLLSLWMKSQAGVTIQTLNKMKFRNFDEFWFRPLFERDRNKYHLFDSQLHQSLSWEK